MSNGEMWLTVIAFVAVVLAVNLIRTRTFDYAWRIAIVAGGVIYVVIMLVGSISFGISISVVSLAVFTVIAVLIGIVLEFFVFGGDYTRTERLEYEDDDYYYYVKAVPKALVTTQREASRRSRRSGKRIPQGPGTGGELYGTAVPGRGTAGSGRRSAGRYACDQRFRNG